MSDFSVPGLVTAIFVCIIAYYLGLSLIELIRPRRKNRKKRGKKK